jgi:hypothetical protein
MSSPRPFSAIALPQTTFASRLTTYRTLIWPMTPTTPKKARDALYRGVALELVPDVAGPLEGQLLIGSCSAFARHLRDVPIAAAAITAYAPRLTRAKGVSRPLNGSYLRLPVAGLANDRRNAPRSTTSDPLSPPGERAGRAAHSSPLRGKRVLGVKAADTAPTAADGHNRGT